MDVGINLPPPWRNKIVFDDVVPVRMTFIHNKIRGIITIDQTRRLREGAKPAEILSDESSSVETLVISPNAL